MQNTRKTGFGTTFVDEDLLKTVDNSITPSRTQIPCIPTVYNTVFLQYKYFIKCICISKGSSEKRYNFTFAV